MLPKFRVLSATGITVTLLLLSSGLLPVVDLASASTDTETLTASDIGITDLDSLGDMIEDLNLPPGSVTFDNQIICKARTTCLGTDNDDIIYAGIGAPVFGLEGNDIIFGALGTFVFGGDGDDIILAGGEIPRSTVVEERTY